MSLKEHAEREMRLAGLYDGDADYGGMIPDAVMALVDAHSAQGHSGASHGLVLSIFNKVINYRTLAPITSDAETWMEVGDNVWQSRRDPAIFSNDGGKTHYHLDEDNRQPRPSAEPALK